MHALTMLLASVVLILVALAVAVVSARFGEDRPYPDDDVPDERENCPRSLARPR